MKKLLVTLLVLNVYYFVSAQVPDTKPVKFTFQVVRLNDTSAYLSINAKMMKEVKLFPAIKGGTDNPFQSSLTLTGSPKVHVKTTDTSTAIGNPQLIKGGDGKESQVFADSVNFHFPLHITKDSALVKGSFVWLGIKGDEYPNGEESFSVQLPSVISQAVPLTKAKSADKSLWSIFLLTFGAGLIAIITPCVFPLVPVTVSFFLKRSKSRLEGIRNAVWYSISIISIYTIPTLILTLVFGDKILYTISTSAISNLLFFAIFIIFAISFFGAFELTLPNSWANKADQQAGKGGLGGIFFMALTLVIVSFSCTGPIVGTLLGQTSTNGVSAAPVIGMLGFGIGLALPFSLFAFFPSMLHSLPKSGGWLNAVKVTFGFIELALAIKFLSNVDLIYHWHLLNRDVFLVIWIVVFGLMGMYLLGKLKFSHDSDVPYVSIPRLFFAIATLCFAVYLVPGLWGAPLQPLSGFIPPATTQDFNLDNLKYSIGTNSSSKVSADNSAAKAPEKYVDKLKVPFGLTAYFDLQEGMAAAKALNKPVMLDFTGHSCANCRKMEEQVWKNPDVLQRMKNDFVLISLYVDESTELPLSEQITTAKGEKIITVGDRNLEYEITKFGFNAQPLYMFLDLQGNPLSEVKYGYDSDAQKFINHLDAVKAAFEKQTK